MRSSIQSRIQGGLLSVALAREGSAGSPKTSTDALDLWREIARLAAPPGVEAVLLQVDHHGTHPGARGFHLAHCLDALAWPVERAVAIVNADAASFNHSQFAARAAAARGWCSQAFRDDATALTWLSTDPRQRRPARAANQPVMRGPSLRHLVRDLSTECLGGRLDEAQALHAMTQALLEEFGCSRVSFWTLSGPLGQRRMNLVAGHDAGEGPLPVRRLQLSETTGEFFDAITTRLCYVVHDTSQDRALRQIYESYLAPTQALAMAVAAYYDRAGTPQGMIACVSGTPRRWTAQEVTQVRNCASEISAYLARRGGGSLLIADA